MLAAFLDECGERTDSLSERLLRLEQNADDRELVNEIFRDLHTLKGSSAFAGLTANEPFYNTALGLAMLFARYWLIVPVLAVAGSLARKKFTPPSPGTLPTHTPLFVTLLVGTVLLVGALTFVPALALGPVVEHLQMTAR